MRREVEVWGGLGRVFGEAAVILGLYQLDTEDNGRGKDGERVVPEFEH